MTLMHDSPMILIRFRTNDYRIILKTVGTIKRFLNRYEHWNEYFIYVCIHDIHISQ